LSSGKFSAHISFGEHHAIAASSSPMVLLLLQHDYYGVRG
jgi:hypothetical protein